MGQQQRTSFFQQFRDDPVSVIIKDNQEKLSSLQINPAYICLEFALKPLESRKTILCNQLRPPQSIKTSDHIDFQSIRLYLSTTILEIIREVLQVHNLALYGHLNFSLAFKQRTVISYWLQRVPNKMKKLYRKRKLREFISLYKEDILIQYLHV